MTRPAANVNGGSKDPRRGSYCTPKWIAERIGRFDLDPFSNPRSHIASEERCMLERGDDGILDPKGPGTFRSRRRRDIASRVWRVFLQPDYEMVDEAIAHYGHTRFCALLRFDPSTKWFAKIYKLTELVCVPRGRRIEFEPAPGIKASKNPYPHALYYARAVDAKPAILRACIAWRTR